MNTYVSKQHRKKKKKIIHLNEITITLFQTYSKTHAMSKFENEIDSFFSYENTQSEYRFQTDSLEEYSDFKESNQDELYLSESFNEFNSIFGSDTLNQNMLTQTKKIQKKSKPKGKNKSQPTAIQETEFSATEIARKMMTHKEYEDMNNPNLDHKRRKKIVQMVRNRISAQNSRDKKKAYIDKLEKENAELKTENFQLKFKIEQLVKEANNKTVCSVCESTSESEVLNSYSLNEYAEIEFSRKSSRNFSTYGPCYLGLLMALILIVNIAVPVSQDGNDIIESNVQLSAGVVPFLGPQVNKSKLANNQIALLEDFCKNHCGAKKIDLSSLVSEPNFKLLQKMKQHRITAADPFYQFIKDQYEKPYEMLTYVNSTQEEHSSVISEPAGATNEIFIENLQNSNVVSYEYYHSQFENMTTAFFPVAIMDDTKFDEDFIHIFIPKNTIKSTKESPDEVFNEFSNSSGEDELVEIIAKIYKTRILNPALPEVVHC